MKIERRYIISSVGIGFMLLFIAIVTSGSTSESVACNHKYMNQSVILRDVPILNYHKVDMLNHPLSISPEEFEEQMSYLEDNGYHTITPDQLMNYLETGKRLPDKPVMLTFDDGYLDNYANAYPIMKRHGFTAVIFVVTSLVGHSDKFMSWEQVKEMDRDGFVFGSHTVKHMALTELSKEQVSTELIDSRQEMQEQMGKFPDYFAYPTGAYNLKIEDQVQQAGYKAAFTIRYGQVGHDSDLYALERIPIFKSKRTFRSFFIRLNAAPMLERLGIIRN